MTQTADADGKNGQKLDVERLKIAAIQTLARNLGEGPPASQVAAARALLEALQVTGRQGGGIKPGDTPASAMSCAAIAAELEALRAVDGS